MAIIEADAAPQTPFEQDVAATQRYFDSPRFEGIVRLYTARQVVEQRGTIPTDYTVAREAAAAFYDRLRELFAQQKSITTFGPYSPGQAVTMKRMGIEGIYLGGWATSAKGSISEDPGPDLASYPLSQVPDEAAGLVRALLTADRNQQYLRLRMTDAQRAATPAVDYRPFIIADADTGHGGDPHVRNLIRRFVEAGVPGYHIEDQRPGTKKCGHQGGKVLVPSDEQIKRLNTARFQLDIMRVPGIIVARTDAEAANLIDSRADERDQPFLLGATNLQGPVVQVLLPGDDAQLLRRGRHGSQRASALRAARRRVRRRRRVAASATASGRWSPRRRDVAAGRRRDSVDDLFDKVESQFVDAWQADAGLETYGEAVAELLDFREREGEPPEMSAAEWRQFAERASLYAAREKARSWAPTPAWDCERAKTPEGYYQVRGGIPYAIAKSLAAAPFADILWMETKTADLADATAVRRRDPRRVPRQDAGLQPVPLVQLGHHRHDRRRDAGLPRGDRQDGLRLQLHDLRRSPDRRRRRRGVRRPRCSRTACWRWRGCSARCDWSNRRTAHRRPWSADRAATPRWPPRRVARRPPSRWARARRSISTSCRPRCRRSCSRSGWRCGASTTSSARSCASSSGRCAPGGEVLELGIYGERDDGEEKLANVLVDPIKDRNGRSILTVRDQNTFAEKLRQKRLMTLIHLWLIHRFKADAVYYVTPTEDNIYQTEKMKSHGIFRDVHQDVGEIVVADVNQPRIDELLAPDREALQRLIRKED